MADLGLSDDPGRSDRFTPDAGYPAMVISGGQTGVDRAALDAALACGLQIGGWCPKGRRAEDGPINARYPLRETPARAYRQRTEWNVRDSDATLILHRGVIGGGTLLTAELAVQYSRPLLVIDLADGADSGIGQDWLRKNSIRVLNVAGPREEGAPGIHAEARLFLLRFLAGVVPGEPLSTEGGPV